MYNDDGEELHDNGMTDEEYIVYLDAKFAKEHLRICSLERRIGYPEGTYSRCTTADEIVEARAKLDARVDRLERDMAQRERQEEAERKRNWKPYFV